MKRFKKKLFMKGIKLDIKKANLINIDEAKT